MPSARAPDRSGASDNPNTPTACSSPPCWAGDAAGVGKLRRVGGLELVHAVARSERSSKARVKNSGLHRRIASVGTSQRFTSCPLSQQTLSRQSLMVDDRCCANWCEAIACMKTSPAPRSDRRRHLPGCPSACSDRHCLMANLNPPRGVDCR